MAGARDTGIADTYKSYQTRFSDILSEIPQIWNDRLRRNKTAKDPVKLLEMSTQIIHSAPYCISQNTREFEKNKIDKM